jgi:hypothetical protein
MVSDRQLIGLFLRGWGSFRRTSFARVTFPEDIEKAARSKRPRKAVDAIAYDTAGNSFAIEHTRIQPFVGRKYLDIGFSAVFDTFEHNPALVVRDFHITVFVPVGAIPAKGVDHVRIRSGFERWFQHELRRRLLKRRRAARVAASGEPELSKHDISGLPIPLSVSIRQHYIKGHPGGLHFVQSHMPENFLDVVRKALQDKLPKLAVATANRRVLLMEKDTLPHTYWDVADCIASLESSFEEFSRIDSVWLADVERWQAGGKLWFVHVWPKRVDDVFVVDEPAPQDSWQEIPAC